MGNSHTVKEFKAGAIVITLDSKHFMAGQTLQGSVSYKFDDNYPSDFITLELIAKEKVMWEGTDLKNKDPKHCGKVVIKRQIFKVVQTVFKFNNGKNKGMQTVRFAIPLPPELPSSILFLGPKQSRIQIMYKLRAKMEELPLEGKVIKYKPLINKRIVIISKPPEKITFDIVVFKH